LDKKYANSFIILGISEFKKIFFSMNTLAPSPPGTYNPKWYDCKIRDVDWKLIGFIVQTKSLDISSASYHLGLPVSSLQNSLEYLKSLGVLP